MQDADNIDIQVENHTIEKVNDFKYLGAYISDNARCENEIKTRLAMTLASMIKYNKTCRNKKIKVNTKSSTVESGNNINCIIWLPVLDVEKRNGEKDRGFRNSSARGTCYRFNILHTSQMRVSKIK